MAPRRDDISVRLLQDFLRSDATLREASAAKFVFRAAAVCIVVSLALGPLIGWRLAGAIAVLLGAIVLYYLVVLVALRRGWDSPITPWMNTFIETSAIAPIMCMDTLLRGPEYALSAPPLVLWGGLITLSALRVNRVLSVAAGLLAAAEYLIIYFFLIYPRLPADTMVAFSPPFIVLRAFFLVLCGIATAIVTHHLLRKAEEALRAVRAQDLMSKYFLHAKLAEGGMGEVYRATYSPEGGFEKTVAVKRILPTLSADPRFVEMFLQEARLCATLHHPNIVQVFDVGRYQGNYILAMEFVDGVSLFRLVHALGRPLPIAAVTFLGAEIAGALDYIHRRTGPDGRPLRLIHCDVNPPNILVSRIGEVKLGDFGVARAANRAVAGADNEVRGKLEYMAPEQLMGKPLDGRTDLYGLGLTLFEALTGQSARSLDGKAKARAAGTIPKPSELRSEIPGELDACLMRLLDSEPGRRTATGLDVRRELTSLAGTVSPFPDGPELLARVASDVLAAAQPVTAGSVTQLLQGMTMDVAFDGDRTRPLRSRRGQSAS